ncbi:MULTISPECIES: DUF2089 family protein [unclassified Priestia]|uniref:DUF2089 family protein n=1 Tax=unclassified Priestia TaxID=2800374 RepID=UPI00366AF501
MGEVNKTNGNDWVLNLSDEDIEFIRKFVINSGSLKKVAKLYEVSYPTVRLRLDRVIQHIKVFDDQPKPFDSYIMKLVVEEKIDFDVGKEILNKHKSIMEENNE